MKLNKTGNDRLKKALFNITLTFKTKSDAEKTPDLEEK